MNIYLNGLRIEIIMITIKKNIAVYKEPNKPVLNPQNLMAIKIKKSFN
jgi:hypothetical protein